MASDSRSKRHIKKKAIYSPSDPLTPDHYVIYIAKFDQDFIVKKSSIKHQSNGKVLISIGGTEKEGEIIASGTYFPSQRLCSEIILKKSIIVNQSVILRNEISL